MRNVSRKPALRVRKSGALVVAALIAFVGTVPFAGSSWQLTPVILIPLAILLWVVRAGTDAGPGGLRVRALFGSTDIPWSRIDQLAPDRRGRVSALLTDGKVIRLTGVTTANLPAVIAAGGHELSDNDQEQSNNGQEPSDNDQTLSDNGQQPSNDGQEGDNGQQPSNGSVAVDDPVDQRLPGGEPA